MAPTYSEITVVERSYQASARQPKATDHIHSLKAYIMNTKSLFAIAAFASLAAAGAHAEVGDTERYDTKAQSTLTRAEVRAQAATMSTARGGEAAEVGRVETVKSTVDRESVRADAIEAVRLSRTAHADAGTV